jgi:Kef-type K+ transport system membrane component KefB/Trk K+ transport system NAD-binding subunit
MSETSSSFLPLLLVVTLAFAVPLVLSRLRFLKLPILVGEILAGIAVGRSGLGLVTHTDPTLLLLSEFGFVFLMFLAGLEIDFSALRVSRSQVRGLRSLMNGPIFLGLISFLATLLLTLPVDIWLQRMNLVKDPFMMALILSTTSLGVVMPVLKEQNLTSGRYGQTMLIAALIADFATMLLITVDVAVVSHGLTLDILLISFLFVVFFLVYRLGILSFEQVGVVRHTLEELSHTTARIKIRGAFAMMLFFVALSEALGVEIVLGAFMAGAMLALLSNAQDVDAAHQLEAIGFGFFIPIFFIMVGVQFNLDALLRSRESLLLLPILLSAAVIVKMAPALLFRTSFGWRETVGAGVLLSSRLSLIIAASAIGLRLGTVSESLNAAVILVAIVSVTLAPPIFQRIMPRKEQEDRPPILVFGAGSLGLLVAEQLGLHHEQVILVDSDEDRLARARQHASPNVTYILARPEAYDTQLATCLDRATTAVVTHSDTTLNRQICELLHTRYGIDHIVALVNDAGEVASFERLNIRVVNPALDQAALLVLLARNPSAYELLTRPQEDKEVLEVEVRTQTIAGRRLRSLPLPGDVLVLALRRGGEFLVPRGNTALEIGDRVTLAGSLGHLDDARRLFER